MNHPSLRRGAAGQQYALIVGLVGVVALLSITAMGTAVGSMMGRTGNTLAAATGGGTGGSSPVTPTCVSGKQTYGTPGPTVFTVPAGCMQLTVKSWGGDQWRCGQWRPAARYCVTHDRRDHAAVQRHLWIGPEC